jgi:hypothetical protein
MAGSSFRSLSKIPHCCLSIKFGPCLSPNVVDHPIEPTRGLRLYSSTPAYTNPRARLKQLKSLPKPKQFFRKLKVDFSLTRYLGFQTNLWGIIINFPHPFAMYNKSNHSTRMCQAYHQRSLGARTHPYKSCFLLL